MDDSELLREAFRPLAGPGLYRANVVRLTGLAPGASAADIRRRRSEVQAAARLGLPAPPPAIPAPLCGPEPPELEVWCPDEGSVSARPASCADRPPTAVGGIGPGAVQVPRTPGGASCRSCARWTSKRPDHGDWAVIERFSWSTT